MKQPIISIVMPAYNAEKFVGPAIQAILSQSFTDFELIVVDDCSNDGTWKIITEFAQKDDRVVVYRTDNNSGSAKYPRDFAVSKSNSDLICWIDSDDIVEVDYLKKLYQRSQETEADIICSQMIAFRNGQGINDVSYMLPQKDLNNNGDKVLSGEVAVMKTVGVKEWTLNANGFLAKKSLWESTSTYLDGKSFWMDVDDVATREMLLNAKNVTFVNALYYYRLHENAITKKISPKRFETLITDRRVMQIIGDRFGNNSYQEKLAKNQYVRRIMSFIRLYVVNFDLLSYEDSNKVRKLIEEHYSYCKIKDVMNSDLSFSQKLAMSLPFTFAVRLIKVINRK